MYSQIGDISYKRLTRTITVPAGGANLSFWTSYNTEEHWDHVFVEARTAGQEDWTTLPDANGHTSQDTGDSCRPVGVSCTRTWTTTRPSRRRHLLPAGRLVPGTPRPGPAVAGSSGQ